LQVSSSSSSSSTRQRLGRNRAMTVQYDTKTASWIQHGSGWWAGGGGLVHTAAKEAHPQIQPQSTPHDLNCLDISYTLSNTVSNTLWSLSYTLPYTLLQWWQRCCSGASADLSGPAMSSCLQICHI
jgi:predicted DNA repair protein MutK